MTMNPNLEFLEPQPEYRTSARVKDETGNLFDIPVAGPQDMLERFIEGKPIQVELGPPKPLDELRKSANSVYGEEDASASDVQSSQQDVPRQEEKEPPPGLTVRALEIGISVVKALMDEYAVYVIVDPDIPEGESHYYSVDGATQAWAECQTAVGDADLFLYEVCSDGTWRLRDSSSAWGTQSDSVSADQEETGNWLLRVLGYKESTYSLSGVFNAL